MKRLRLGVALLLLLPAAGCVFAVGGDDERNEELRDRVRALEHRIDRLEGEPAVQYGRARRSTEFHPVPPRPPDPPETVPGGPK